MRDITPRRPSSCFAWISVPALLTCLGPCNPWKNNPNPALVPATAGTESSSTQLGPSGAISGGPGVSTSDADSMISPSEIYQLSRTALRDRDDTAVEDRFSADGRGPTSAGTPSGFYAASLTSNLSNVPNQLQAGKGNMRERDGKSLNELGIPNHINIFLINIPNVMRN